MYETLYFLPLKLPAISFLGFNVCVCLFMFSPSSSFSSSLGSKPVGCLKLASYRCEPILKEPLIAKAFVATALLFVPAE